MSTRVPERDDSIEGAQILVVDDDRDVAASLCDLIEAAGYRAIVANSADAALKFLSTNEADLVISDVRMPGIDGFEFCQAARDQMKDDYVPIILLTGNADEFEIRRGLDSGADDFLMKPPRMTDLLAKVRAFYVFECFSERIANKLNYSQGGTETWKNVCVSKFLNCIALDVLSLTSPRAWPN